MTAAYKDHVVEGSVWVQWFSSFGWPVYHALLFQLLHCITVLIPAGLWSFIRTFALSLSCQCVHSGVHCTPGHGQGATALFILTPSSWVIEPMKQGRRETLSLSASQQKLFWSLSVTSGCEQCRHQGDPLHLRAKSILIEIRGGQCMGRRAAALQVGGDGIYWKYKTFFRHLLK